MATHTLTDDHREATVADAVRDARGLVEELTSAQVEARLLDPATLLVDVREHDEVASQGHIAGAVHVPRGLLEFAADPTSGLHRPEFDRDRPTILYCSRGARSALAGATLRGLGYGQVAHLAEGFEAWCRDGRAVAGLAPWHAG